MQDKCRVLVKQGVLLIGIMDETGMLPDGTFWASWDHPADLDEDTYATRPPSHFLQALEP